MQLTTNQLAVSQKLEKFLWLKQSGATKVAGIEPRTTPCIVGPSGSGKTATVAHFCNQHELPMLPVPIGNWVPIGAKHESFTLHAIAEFVSGKSQGVIFLDEINKFRSSHLEQAWSAGVLNEVIALLDGDERLLTGKFDKEMVQRLKSRFLIIGAGAWQDEWNACRPRPTVGFQGSEAKEFNRQEAYQQAINASGDFLPEELLFRFFEPWLFILPPSKREIAKRICAIRAELGLAKLSTQSDCRAWCRRRRILRGPCGG